MDGVDGCAQSRALWEILSGNVQPALGSDTGQTRGKGTKQPEAFVDDGVEIGKGFDCCPGCDRVIFVCEGFVKLCLEFGLGSSIPGEIVGNSAGGTRTQSISVIRVGEIENGRNLTRRLCPSQLLCKGPPHRQVPGLPWASPHHPSLV